MESRMYLALCSIIASGTVAASTMHLMKNHPDRMAKSHFLLAFLL